MTADVDQARKALAAVPALAGRAASAKIARLGGLTNLVFKIDDDFCLRIPGKGTEEYINRANEAVAAREAARARVSPEVIHFDAGTGIMVTKYIDGAVTMSPANFKSRAGSPARAGRAFRQLHDSNAKFNFRFELFAMIDGYLRILATKDVDLPAGYHDVVREAEAVRTALDAHPLPLTACHCDPLCENFLDTGVAHVDRRLGIFRNERSAFGTLAISAVEGLFDAAQEEEMIRAYFSGEAKPAERGRIVIYKAMCDLLWTLWGLIQHANKNPVDDFWAYATNRFERCKTC